MGSVRGFVGRVVVAPDGKLIVVFRGTDWRNPPFSVQGFLSLWQACGKIDDVSLVRIEHLTDFSVRIPRQFP